MARTASYDALLTVCIQDLHEGETQLGGALSKIAAAANDPALRRLLDRAATAADAAAETLAATGRHVGGATNLWMAGILDDARRDTRSIDPGPLLDAAIVGAVRKAKAAQVVSYDTAIGIARALAQDEAARSLEAIRQAAMSISRRLANRLPGRLSPAAPPSGSRPTPRHSPRRAASSRARTASA